MQLEIKTYEYGSRPGVQMPDPEFLKQMKEEGIRKLINDHYDLLAKSEAKDLFPKNEKGLEKAKQRSSDFFIQMLGGHPYYKENRGEPKLTDRHRPFKITPEARKVWLQCYQQLLPELNIPEAIILSFWNYLNVFSVWMINTPEATNYSNIVITK